MRETILRRYGPDVAFAMMSLALGLYWLTRGEDVLVGWMHVMVAAGWLMRVAMPEGTRARTLVTVAVIVVVLAFLAFSIAESVSGR